MTDFVVCLGLLVGTFFIAVSSLGLVRMPDVYARIHAVTKASTLGMAGLLLASAIAFLAEGANVGAELVTLLFLFLTTPVGGHMIGRAAYLGGVPMTDASVIDQMQRAGEKADVEHDTD